MCIALFNFVFENSHNKKLKIKKKRDHQLKIITYRQVVTYELHGNYKPKIYNRYTPK